MAKRRRRGNAQSRAQRDSIIPINTVDMKRKNHFPIQVFKSDTFYHNYDVFNADGGSNTASLSGLPIDLSNSNSRKSANIDLSTFSARRDRRVSIKRVSNIEKPIETGNKWIKPPNHTDDDETTPSIQHSAVTVQRISKSANLNTTNNNPNNQLETIDQRCSLALTSKTGRVSVKKIPRKKLNINQLERSSSICHGNVTDLGKSSIEMKPITNQLNGALSTGNDATRGVTVIKLSRNSAIN